MPGKIIVDEIRPLKQNIDEVYSGCISWLFSINATIMRTEKPRSIIASHGGGYHPDADYRDWSKIIEVDLSERDAYTMLRVVMREPDENTQVVGTENREAYWATLLNGLYEMLSIELIESEKREVYPVEYFKKESLKNVKNAASILVLLGSIGTYFLFYPLDDSIFGSAVLAILAVMIYTVTRLYKQFKLRKEYMSFFPDDPSSPGKIGWLLLTVILLSLPLTITVLYYGNFGCSTVDDFNSYSGYSFTFQYPEGIEFDASSLHDDMPATNSQGMIIGEEMRGLGQTEGVMVMWFNILYFNDDYENALDIQNATYLGSIKDTIIENSTVHYRSVMFPVGRRQIHSIWAVWYCDSQKRSYSLCYFNTKNVTYPRFMRILHSFKFESITSDM